LIETTKVWTHINKKIKKAVPQAAKRYASELMEEVNADRKEHGKKPFDSTQKPPKEKEITVSKTDPESGLFQKGEHKKCFAYEAHTACDKHNFVLGVEVTPGNVHDSVAFDAVYDKVTKQFPKIETVVADAAYKTPHICKRVFDDKRVLSTAYKRPMTKAGHLQWWKYVYDEYYDCVTRSDIVPDRVLHGEKQYYVTVEETEDETKAPESSNVYVTPSMVRDVLTTYCPFS
jgi:hypothetical protein